MNGTLQNENKLVGTLSDKGSLNGGLGTVFGRDGKDGVDGKSTYDIWLEEGNTGTEADFLASLKGEPGERGEQGIRGEKGDTGVGVKGDDGKDGEDGFSPTVSVRAIIGGHRITIVDAYGAKTVDVMDGSDGKDGATGSAGKDGNGIKSAVLNADYTLTLTFTDGTHYTTPSIRGATGAVGQNGKDGTSVTIKSVSESTVDGGGNVVTFSDGKTVTIKNGSKGEKGADGTMTFEDLTAEQKASLKGDKGDKGDAFTYADFTTEQLAALKGEKGDTGATGSAGKDGVSGKDGTSVTVTNVSESSADGGNNVVTFSDGKTVTIKNGSKGSTGASGSNGKDGTSVTVSNVTESTASGGTNTVTFSDGKKINIKNGVDGKDGSNGQDGASGKDGVGVSTVKQTTTSSADGGTNVVTVTLSNGTSSTFSVKNGSKGSKGDTGAQGVSGVYVGTGDMPSGYNVQIDPDGEGESFEDIIEGMVASNAKPLRILNVAHRGGMPTEAPENTLIGYAKAAEMGFDYCEMDIRFTSDGIPVLLHDATINRTARNADGSIISSTINIADITYSQAQQYVFCSGLYSEYPSVRIPTLEEAIALCRSVGIKPWFDMYFTPTTANIGAIFETLDKYGMRDNVVWSSSTYNDIYFIKNYYEKANICTRSSTYSDTTSMLNGLANLSTEQNTVYVNVRLEDMETYSPLLRENGYEVMYVTPTKEQFIGVYPLVTAVMSEDYLASEYVIEYMLNEYGTEVVIPETPLLALNRTQGTNWTNENNYINPAHHESTTISGNLCGIANLTENSITVTENGAGGRGVAFPFVPTGREGKTYQLTWNATGTTDTRFRLLMGDGSSMKTADLDVKNGTITSATISISADRKTITVNGKATTFTNAVSWLAFFFGAATSKTVAYTGVSLVEVTQ